MSFKQVQLLGQLLYELQPGTSNSVRLFSNPKGEKNYLGRAILDEKGNFTLDIARFKLHFDKATALPEIEAKFTLDGKQFHVDKLPLKEIKKYVYQTELKLSKEGMQKARAKFKSLGLKIENLKDLEVYEKDLAILMREIPNGGNLFTLAPVRFLAENHIHLSTKAALELRKSMCIVGPVPGTKYDLIAKGLRPKAKVNL